MRAVYASIDPATVIMEVAVHKGFKVLNTTPHMLTSTHIPNPSDIHVVKPGDVPNSNWLVPGSHWPGQQAFGDQLLQEHIFVLVPSTVSKYSWNLIFDANQAKGHFTDVTQERFVLDPRPRVYRVRTDIPGA